MARTSAELTPEEILIIGDLVPVGSPGQVPVVNTGGTGLEYKTFSGGGDMLASTYDPAGGARQVSFACTTQTAITDYTFTGSEARDSGYLVTTASNRTVNINADLFTTGYEVSICKGTNNTNTVTIDAQTGNNINGSQTFVLTQYNEVVTLLKDGADTWKIKSHYYPISGVNTGDQTSTAGLSNTTNKNLVTDAQLTVIGNTSGTNTGDNATNTTSNAYALTTPAFWQYSISRTVSTGNMTVAVKNYLGNDPSPTVPIYVMIGGVMRTITSALSFTNSAGFNWGYTGSTELATKEVDWFCYFVWRTGESTVKLTASRIPYATIYGDFNTADATTEKGNLGNFGSPISTDPVVNIGRFNAILSAGAGYTWSIPATSVVINSPTIFTRTIQGGSQTGWTANNLLFYYTVNGDRVDFSFDANGTSNSTSSYITLPFSAKTIMAHNFALGLTYDNGAEMTTPGRADLYGQYCTLYKDSAYGAWTASGAKIIRGQGHYYI